MGSASDRESLRRALEPVVTAEGFDLEDVVVTPAGKRRMLRVVVDKDGGVDLDDIARVSTTVSGALDASDAMGGAPYVLEVTSPGVDRPLTQPRHWRRAEGHLVKATLAEETVVGRITASTDTEVTLDVEGTSRTLLQAEVTKAVVQVEFTKGADA
jgi:ribosome maturation factor RimP